MDAPDPVVANAELWSAYLYKQWRGFFDLFGGRDAAAGVGASIAEAHASAVGPRIDDLYRDNSREVSRYVDETIAQAPPIDDAPPEWLLAVIDADAHTRERVLERLTP
jgi:hypothetical protein